MASLGALFAPDAQFCAVVADGQLKVRAAPLRARAISISSHNPFHCLSVCLSLSLSLSLSLFFLFLFLFTWFAPRVLAHPVHPLRQVWDVTSAAVKVSRPNSLKDPVTCAAWDAPHARRKRGSRKKKAAGETQGAHVLALGTLEGRVSVLDMATGDTTALVSQLFFCEGQF